MAREINIGTASASVLVDDTGTASLGNAAASVLIDDHSPVMVGMVVLMVLMDDMPADPAPPETGQLLNILVS